MSTAEDRLFQRRLSTAPGVISVRPELLWPDFCPTGGGALNTSEFGTAESVAICCVTTEQNPGRKMEE